MADNISIQSGPTIRTREVGNVHTQLVADNASTQPLFQFLTEAGDGTGAENAIGDYSGGGLGEAQFHIVPPASTIYEIHTMIITVEDSAIAAAKYGNLTALTNGISVQKRQGDTTVEIDITNGRPIKRNADWGTFSFNADVKSWGVGNEFLLVCWNFDLTGARLRLDGDAAERLTVVLNDNFTGVDSHLFFVHGHTY